MRDITASSITDAVRALCIEANCKLPEDLYHTLCASAASETDGLSKSILLDLQENVNVAQERHIPICQDTGMAVVFVRLGQEVHIVGGLLTDAINEGVATGYRDGGLRCSVVSDPLRRVNTGDNTPAIIHTELVEGDELEITVAPKGFGSENMSRVYMLTPAADRKDIIDAVCETVKAAGSNACPPMVLGVGIGGDFEQVTYLAKKALCRSVAQPNDDAYYAELEKDILTAINALGIGSQGFGGDVTALAVMIEAAPTHIAGLPLAINVGCHVTRHATCRL